MSLLGDLVEVIISESFLAITRAYLMICNCSCSSARWVTYIVGVKFSALTFADSFSVFTNYALWRDLRTISVNYLTIVL
jgi:hypothetical protein